MKLVLDARVADRQPARRTPREAQTYTIQAEPAFFINGFYCTAQCDGDGYNPLDFRAAVRVADFAAAIRATDITVRRTGRAKAAGAASSAGLGTRRQ